MTAADFKCRSAFFCTLQARLIDRAFLADAGHDVGERAAPGDMHERIVDGDQRRAVLLGEIAQGFEPVPVVAHIEVLAGEIDIARAGVDPAFDPGREAPVQLVGRQDDQGLPLRMGEQVFFGYEALALGAGAAAERDQARQAAIGRAVGRVGEKALAAGEIEPCADDQVEPDLLGLGMGAHDAGQRIAVGDGNGLMAEKGGLRDELFRL